MRIYHYTTLETLALILKNKTIRFHRLDKINGDIGTYKNKIWEFQNESRFVINIYPWTNGHFDINASHQGVSPIDLKTNPELPIQDYDLLLKDDAFDKLEITMSPDFSYANEIILHSLVKEYAPKALIKESELKGMVVFK